MANDFFSWLNENGLVEAFTTSAGDTLYVNNEKKFCVLRKHGEYNVQSFYFSDMVEFKTYDDEKLIAEWNCFTSSWRVCERSTRFSTNEVYMKIRLGNQLEIKLQIFRATNGNISRDTANHVNLFNYACQISQIVYNLAINR